MERLWTFAGHSNGYYHPDSHDVTHSRPIAGGHFMDFRGEDEGGLTWRVFWFGTHEGPIAFPPWCLRFPEQTGQPHLYDVTEEQERLIVARMAALEEETKPPLATHREWFRLVDCLGRGIPLRGRPYWAPPHMSLP